MPSFSGKFEYAAPESGAVLQGGPCEVAFDGERMTLVSKGPSIAFDLGDIDVFRSGDYALALSLYTGHELRLVQFGKAFQNLERELLEAYRDRLVRCLLVSDLDEVARFSGRASLESAGRTCEGPAEIRLYESNLAVLPDAATGFQWRLADIDDVAFDEREYRIVVSRGAERLALGHLARRTGELVERLRERMNLTRERAAAALHAVFPFLSAEQFRQVASLLREGATAPIASLGPIHRLIESTLLEKVVEPGLRPYLRALVSRSGSAAWFCGFKIVRRDPDEAGGSDDEEVEREGSEAEVEDAPTELESGQESNRAESAEPQAQSGDLDVLYWFFFPLASPGSAVPSHVAWEATSKAGRATYVFRLDGSMALEPAVQTLTTGLVALNFRREPVYLASDVLESDIRYRHYAIAVRKLPELRALRAAFAGRAIHRSVAAWQRQLDEHLR